MYACMVWKPGTNAKPTVQGLWKVSAAVWRHYLRDAGLDFRACPALCQYAEWCGDAPARHRRGFSCETRQALEGVLEALPQAALHLVRPPSVAAAVLGLVCCAGGLLSQESGWCRKGGLAAPVCLTALSSVRRPASMAKSLWTLTLIATMAPCAPA